MCLCEHPEDDDDDNEIIYLQISLSSFCKTLHYSFLLFLTLHEKCDLLNNVEQPL